MFRLDMQALRQSAGADWLMANSANLANEVAEQATEAPSSPEISQEPPKLAGLAGLAISHDVSHESAELLTARLIAAAKRRCDQFDDGEEARAQMRADIMATPAHLRGDLLAHFRSVGARGG